MNWDVNFFGDFLYIGNCEKNWGLKMFEIKKIIFMRVKDVLLEKNLS